MTAERRLDVRVWLLWAGAAMVPPLIGRNPFMLAVVLIVVVVVRTAWMPVARRRFAPWGGLVRVVVVLMAVGVVFNLLTVHAGTTVLFRLPGWLPLAGGPITLNALVFGILSGAALVALVLVGTTAAAVLDWPALMRVVPDRAAPLAVAGSVAWAFLPGVTAAWREIREAQAARGFRRRGPRGLTPVVVPLLDGGLERALTMAEALEARGFGAAAPGQGTSAPETTWRGVLMALGAASAALAAYALAVGSEGLALAATLLAAPLVVIALRGNPHHSGRTRYRVRRWTTVDSRVAVCAATALVATVLRAWAAPDGLRYDPYLGLSWPAVDLPLLLGLSLLLAPALAAPAAGEVPTP